MPPRLGCPASAPQSTGGRCSGQADNVAPAARLALSRSRRLTRRTVRRVGYGGSMGNSPLKIEVLLPLQPQRCGAIAVVEAGVGGKVLHIRLPGGRDRGGV